MNIKQTVKTPEGRIADNITALPIEYFGKTDKIRIGFTKGTVKKATFELHSGAEIIYEPMED